MSKSWQRTTVGGIDAYFYNVEKMSGQKGNLEKRQGVKSEKQGQFERNKQQCTELLCGNSQIKGRTRPNGLFKMVPDPVKRKARDRNLFGAGDWLD